MIAQSQMHQVLKEVLCPLHNKPIIKINLSPLCENNERLFCEQCEIKNDDFVYRYEDIFLKIKQSPSRPRGHHFFKDIKVVREELMSQFEFILHKLEIYTNFYISHPITDDLCQKLISPDQCFNLEDLLELSKKLSEKIVNNKYKIQFKKPYHDPRELISQIHKSILTWKNCCIDIAQIMNLTDPKTRFLHYCAPVIDSKLKPDKIQIVNYDLLISKQLEGKVSQIELGFYLKYIAVAGDQKLNDRYNIDIFDLDFQNKSIKLNQQLTKHKNRIQILQSAYFLFSVDEGRQVIAWDRDLWNQLWSFYKQFDVSTLMFTINCIACSIMTNWLAIGGDNLLLWAVDKQDYQFLDFNCEEVQCLQFNKYGNLLLSGSKKGNISAYAYQGSKWQLVLNKTLVQNEVRSFISLSNLDFISIQKGNQFVLWKLDQIMKEYEYKFQDINGLDQAFVSHRALVIPHIMDINGNIIQKEFDCYSHERGEYFVGVRNDQILFFGASYKK